MWVAHADGSMSVSGYDYGSSSLSAMGDNLSFRGVVYDVCGPHFEDPPTSSDHDFVDEEPNKDTRAFYDLLIQEDQKLYSYYNFASPLYTMTTLLNIKTSHNIPQTTFNV